MRRIAFATLVAVAVLLVGALPAAAAASATVQSPGADQVITGSVPIQVCVTRDLVLESFPDWARVRLSRDGSEIASGSSEAQVAQTSEECGSDGRLYTGVALEPRSPDEFGLGTPLANGTWYVQSKVEEDAWSGPKVALKVPPSAVSGLTAEADRLDVTLTWKRAPEPDITAYRIQRRPDGGSWHTVASTGSSASTYEDTTPSGGTYEYRVVTVRSDGQGGALTTTSSATSVATSSSSTGSSPSGDDGTEGGASTSTDGSTSDGSTGSGSDDPGTEGSSEQPADADGSSDGEDPAGATDGDGDGSSTSVSGSSRPRIAAPPGVRRGSSLRADIDLPDPEVAPRQEEFYGEGDTFSEELDYGGAGPVAPDAPDRSVLRRVPGGFQEFIVSRFETRTLLRSIAAGLLFVTLGLHAYRWMHATPND